MAEEKIRDFWYQMTLRKKLYAIIGGAALLMAASIGINLQVVYYFIDNVQTIMDDNLSCYKFQDSMEEEAIRFSGFITDQNRKNEEAYLKASRETKEYLENLPYDYNKVGEVRYGITWNIINSYGVYEKQKTNAEKMMAIFKKKMEGNE